MSENLPIDFYLDENDLPLVLPLEGDEEVKLDPEETIAQRVKLYPWKLKKWRNKVESIESKQTIN